MEPVLALVLVHTAIVALSPSQVEPSILTVVSALLVLAQDKVDIAAIYQLVEEILLLMVMNQVSALELKEAAEISLLPVVTLILLR